MGTPNNNDDWTDLKTKGAAGKVAAPITITKDSANPLIKDWVGYNDEYDYKAFKLNSAAALSLTIKTTGNTPGNAKFTIYQLVESTDKQGNKTYSLKSLQSVTPKYDKNTKEYYVITKSLLLLKGTYYIGVQATNAKNANSDVNYTISLQNKSAGAFYTKAVNTDDWDDLKTKGAAGKVGAAVAVTAGTGNIIANNWVGFSDEFDYKAFTLGSAATISLSVTSGMMSDCGKQVIKVGVYALQSSTDKKGVTTYSLKKLQEVSPKYDKSTNKYVIDTAALLLDKGTYYIGVQSTNAKNGGSTDYTIALNKTASEFYATAVSVTAGTGNIINNDWVGYGDEYDYQAITLTTAAKLSLAITSTDAVKISICKLDGKDGKYSFKSLKSAAAKLNKTTNKYTVNTDALLLEKGTYYVCVQSTNAKKAGTKATYTVSLNKTASTFYTKGNNTDDWDDLKEKGAAGKVAKIATPVTASSTQIVGDWVGYGDEWDYKAVTLNSAAMLSITITATDETKFTAYTLVSKTDKNNVTTYSLKQLKSVKVKAGTFVIDGILADKGTYYIGVQSTNAKKGGSSDYTISLNKNASIFYTKGNNADDWEDLKTKGKAGKVAAAVTVSGSTGQFISDWVGYGDEYDYKAFTLNSAANLSLTINSTDATKFTIYSLVESTDKKGNKTYSLKKLQSVDAKYDKTTHKYTVTTKSLLLDKGTYYLCAQSTNAKKGGSADYTVSLNKSNSEFFTKGSTNDNNWDAAPVLNGALDSSGDLIGTTTGWVGYGDPVDYRTFTTNAANGNGGYYVFSLGLTGTPENQNNLNLSLYEIVEDKGIKSLKKLRGATATKDRYGVIGVEKNLLMLKANTKYVVCVEAPGAKQAKNSSYELEVYQDAYAHFNMANNERTKATKMGKFSSDVYNTLTKTAGGDSVDWYDISEFTGSYYEGLELTNTFESVSLKLTFYTSSMVETKVWVQDYYNGKWSETSSTKLNTKYGVLCDFYETKDLKYLKVEATSSARNSYRLGVAST